MNNSAIYFLGFLVLIGGLAYAAITAGVPGTWVGIGAVILLGIGIMSTVSKTTSRPPVDSDDGEVTRTTTTVREKE